MKTEIISIFENREDVDKILFKIKKFSFSDFSKHPHFEFSVLESAIMESRHSLHDYRL